MRAHVEQFAARDIPFIFDPGQGLPLFSRPGAARVDRRGDVSRRQRLRGPNAAERTGFPLEELAEQVEALIVTLGARRLAHHAGGGTSEIPAVAAAAVVDPTGCGDAYRAGLLYGIGARLGLGADAAGSRHCSARSRSRSAAGRTIASTRI